MSFSPGHMGDNFIPSSSDPHWDADETPAQFFNRCVLELSAGAAGLFSPQSEEEQLEQLEQQQAHLSSSSNTTHELDNGSSSSSSDGSGTPESACETIMFFKKYGLYGPGYSDTRQLMIIVSYSLLIVVGTITNLSVCWVVLRHSQARTARNLFIINLAISDLSVCLITMPLTMLRLIHLPSWNYGSNLCKMIGLLEGANLLVSSGTASAIAGDRLCLVTRKTARHNDTKVSTIALILLLIWSLSFLSFLPTFFFNGTYNLYLPGTDLVLYHVCAEFWPSHPARFAFTAFLMVVQYVLPISVILVTHVKIIGIVKLRMTRVNNLRKESQGIGVNNEDQATTGAGSTAAAMPSAVTAATTAATVVLLSNGSGGSRRHPNRHRRHLRYSESTAAPHSAATAAAKAKAKVLGLVHRGHHNQQQQQQQQQQQSRRRRQGSNLRPSQCGGPTMRRNKKTTQILLIIALCFGISWLPYHCFMIVLEANKMLESDVLEMSSQTETDVFTLVHLLAMSSTITNPILYGWLNTNLKHLFRAMIPYVRQDRQQEEGANGVAGGRGGVSGEGGGGGGGASAGASMGVGEERRTEMIDRNGYCLGSLEEQATLTDNISSMRSSPESLRNKEEEEEERREQEKEDEEIELAEIGLGQRFEDEEEVPAATSSAELRRCARMELGRQQQQQKAGGRKKKRRTS